MPASNARLSRLPRWDGALVVAPVWHPDGVFAVGLLVRLAFEVFEACFQRDCLCAVRGDSQQRG